MKKILLISLVAVMIVLGAGAYYFFFGQSTTPSKTISTQSQLAKVTDDQVISPIPSYDNNKIWYFNDKGQLFQLTLDGNSLNEFTFPDPITNFRRAYWAPSGSNLIIGTGDGAGSKLLLYDAEAKQIKMLPQNIQSFDWMPDGQRIVYVWKSGDGKTQQLILANADTSGYRKISDLFWPDMIVKVSPDGKHALLTRGEVQDPNKIYMVGLESGQFTTVAADGKNIQTQWVDASRFLYVQAADGKYALKLYDLSSNQSSNLGFSATLDMLAVDKLGKYLYVDTVIDSGDEIVKVDLSNLQQTNLYQFTDGSKPHNLFVADNTLFYINGVDGKLYSISQ